ncbi:MAG TPA: hypothetical protein VFG87_27705 [Amycolatopsis sp.]|nr:hypothetical protein [Amycolatopsis sp.]
MPIERLICSYGEEACEITASYIALREHIKPYVLSAPLDRIPRCSCATARPCRSILRTAGPSSSGGYMDRW